jgi:hypothetical protein
MLVSHESPLCLLEKSREYNDYDYALVHLFQTEFNYFDFFVESLKQGRKVILDNSVFELGEAFDSKLFAQYVEALKPTEYIIPDVLENAHHTIYKAACFKRDHPNLPGKSIGVVQGKTYEDLLLCYKTLDQLGVDKIAISFDYSYYREVCNHPNKWMAFTLGRVQTLTRMLNEGIINKNKPHHLLGCALPIEFLFYREGFEWIETMDTSSPVVHGLLNILYEPGGLVNKQSIKLVDLLHSNPTPEQIKLIEANVTLFRSYVNGTKSYEVT